MIIDVRINDTRSGWKWREIEKEKVYRYLWQLVSH
jgi:hypothetical protein